MRGAVQGQQGSGPLLSGPLWSMGHSRSSILILAGMKESRAGPPGNCFAPVGSRHVHGWRAVALMGPGHEAVRTAQAPWKAA